jgi:hypothetical protein
MRFGTMCTRLARLGEKGREAYYEYNPLGLKIRVRRPVARGNFKDV